MRKTCKNHPKNEQKTHQKSSKNRSKKHTEKLTTQLQPKGRQKVHIKRPTREGKGGIQDGSLLEKKRILQKPDLLRGKGACGKVTRRHFQAQHAPAVGRKRPGGESRLPAAIVPPPGLGKIVCMRKFARNLIPGSMQECFFTNFCLKN